MTGIAETFTGELPVTPVVTFSGELAEKACVALIGEVGLLPLAKAPGFSRELPLLDGELGMIGVIATLVTFVGEEDVRRGLGAMGIAVGFVAGLLDRLVDGLVDGLVEVLVD